MRRSLFLLLLNVVVARFCSAQVVPVSKEPMHHNVFENSFLRVLDVHVLPGDTTLFHKHETPSVFIVLTPVKTGSEVIIEDGKSTALSKDAAISFESFARSPRVHRVWNEDSIEFHVMDVEILNKDPRDIQSYPTQPGLRLLFDEKTVRGYRLTLNPNSKITVPSPGPSLVVCLDNGLKNVKLNKTSLWKKGDFLFLPAGEQLVFDNKDEASFSFAVIEIK